MYRTEHLKIGLRHPRLGLRELNRQYYRLSDGGEFNTEGLKIIDEDWDVLIILDACRYDMFESENSIDGTLTSRTSRGSNTAEFLHGNFKNGTHLDTVYTTANPQLRNHAESINVEFHDVRHVWESDRWDAELGTVTPDAMTAACRESLDRYPHKRHIFHYLQPHYPFIGTQLEGAGRGITEEFGTDIWGLKMRGELGHTKDRLRSAYRANLQRALDSIEELLPDLSGRVVITSDHGNMVGERSRPIPIREWGHPSGTYTPQLVAVPWLVVDAGQRPAIRSEASVQEDDTAAEAVVADRLKDLGYV